MKSVSCLLLYRQRGNTRVDGRKGVHNLEFLSQRRGRFFALAKDILALFICKWRLFCLRYILVKVWPINKFAFVRKTTDLMRDVVEFSLYLSFFLLLDPFFDRAPFSIHREKFAAYAFSPFFLRKRHKIRHANCFTSSKC